MTVEMPHGTVSTYTNRRCRCEACKAARREYDRARAAVRAKERRAARAEEQRLETLRRRAGSRCAKGAGCVAADPADLYPTPAPLSPADDGPMCCGCRKRAGVA